MKISKPSLKLRVLNSGFWNPQFDNVDSSIPAKSVKKKWINENENPIYVKVGLVK